MTWEVYSCCSEAHPWSLRLSSTRHWKQPHFSLMPAAPMGAAITLPPGSGRAPGTACGGSWSFLKLQLRAVAPNTENERQQLVVEHLYCLRSSAESVSHPCSRAMKAMACSSQPATVSKILPPFCHRHPRAQGRRRGLHAPCSHSLTKALWVLKSSKLNFTSIILTWSLYQISLAKHFIWDKKYSVPSNKSHFSYLDTDGTYKQLQRW